MSSLLLLLFLLLPSPSAPTFTPLEQDELALFRAYLQIPTPHPNPNYTAPVAFLASLARSIPTLRTSVLDFSGSKTKPLLLVSWPGLDPTLPSLLLNSHLDSVPVEPSKWLHPPFSAALSVDGRIFARGTQDDKSISLQYLLAIRNLSAASFSPLRSVHLSFVPDEEIGGAEGTARFAASEEFRRLNVGFVLDEGQASPTEEFRVFYADRSPWSLIVRAVGPPAHGSRMFDGSAAENLMGCVEKVAGFRESQFDLVKAGVKATSEVVSVNPVYIKAGTPTPTVCNLFVEMTL